MNIENERTAQSPWHPVQGYIEVQVNKQLICATTLGWFLVFHSCTFLSRYRWWRDTRYEARLVFIIQDSPSGPTLSSHLPRTDSEIDRCFVRFLEWTLWQGIRDVYGVQTERWNEKQKLNDGKAAKFRGSVTLRERYISPILKVMYSFYCIPLLLESCLLNLLVRFSRVLSFPTFQLYQIVHWMMGKVRGPYLLNCFYVSYSVTWIVQSSSSVRSEKGTNFHTSRPSLVHFPSSPLNPFFVCERLQFGKCNAND
jgi:hypothetical protein